MKRSVIALLILLSGISGFAQEPAVPETNTIEVLKKDLAQLQKSMEQQKLTLDSQIKSMRADLDKMSRQLGDRYGSSSSFNTIEKRVQDLERDMDRIENQLRQIDSQIRQLNSKR